MKKVLVAGITAAVFCGAPVFAADMPVKAPPMAAPVFNWSGWYAGINGGYAWSDNGDITYRDPGGTGATIKGFDSNGGFGGGQLGFNVQSGQLVWGLETDIQGSDIRKTFGPIIVTNNNTGYRFREPTDQLFWDNSRTHRISG
jgi:outer membrane immunogenic protein